MEVDVARILATVRSNLIIAGTIKNVNQRDIRMNQVKENVVVASKIANKAVGMCKTFTDEGGAVCLGYGLAIKMQNHVLEMIKARNDSCL